jgi:hypothetical protein
VAVAAVSDERVDRAIWVLSQRGYEPNPVFFEPIRAYLAGCGLLLSGPQGVGKTFFFRCAFKGAQAFVQHCQEDVCAWGFDGIREWFALCDGREILLDDFGAERTTVSFGQRDELMRLVVAHRAERQSGRTHVTTNLTAEQLSARYGDHTLSRILGMCRPFRIEGADRRLDWAKEPTKPTVKPGLSQA